MPQNEAWFLLECLVAPFDPVHVGICLDVNHVMERWKELPEIIARLAPRLRTLHISDYDGVDEMHWFPGQGIIDWPALMNAIRALDHEVLLIYETTWQLGLQTGPHIASPAWAVRQVENSIWFLENHPELLAPIRLKSWEPKKLSSLPDGLKS